MKNKERILSKSSQTFSYEGTVIVRQNHRDTSHVAQFFRAYL